MGVQGLWELLTPVGRRVSVDALGSRKLAIDASIWIIQFMKAMRDDKGDMIRNAHLLGFFRRICKLLFLRIKPVFVFDGATPALKRRTVLARRRQREQAQSRIRKTAEKLLLNHLRTRKLEEIASEISPGPQAVKTKRITDVGNTFVFDPTSEGQSRSDIQVHVSGPSSSNDKYDNEATDALLAASLAADYGENLEKDRESADGSDDDDDTEEQLILPTAKGLDPSVLASLPPSMQLDLLVQMREQLVAENRQKFQKVAQVPSSFSKMQIQAYLKTVAFRREINEVQKAAAGGGIGGVPTARVASTTDREFVFSKSFEGEKPAPKEIQEQRQSEQARSAKATQSKLPTSLSKPSSVLFSSIMGSEEQSAVEEGGVVSLVSTELNKATDSNSNSVVHTYIDERGHVRVNRRRGMGVRMTRDLQWNLYLMKDVQARNLEQRTSTAELPIPSSSIGNTALSTSSASQSTSFMEQGFQISFVDEGGSELSKDEDGDLFEELVMGGDCKDDQTSAIHGPTLAKNNEDTVNLGAGVISGEDMEDEVEWEDGGVNESRDGSVVEDKDLAEALRLSLVQQPPAVFHNDLQSNGTLLEEGPSSGESEVEWEDGTGDVSVVGLDVATNAEVTGATSMPSEEAEFEEAIRRSLEDFCSPPKPSSQLVIKEPTENHPNSATHGLKVLSKYSPVVRAESEPEEVYLARERTRKGKAVLGGDEDGSLSSVVGRPYPVISEQEQIAAITLSEMPVIEATLQTPARHGSDSFATVEIESQEKIDFRSICIPTAAANHTGKEEFGVPSNFQNANYFVEEIENVVKVDQIKVENSRADVSEIHSLSVQPDVPLAVAYSENLAGVPLSEKSQVATPLDAIPEVGRSLEQAGQGLPFHSLQSRSQAENNLDNQVREVEEVPVVMEKKDLNRTEAGLAAEREKLAREEASLQAEIEMEQENIQTGLDRERELLAHEEMELLATQRKNERNADSVTGEMFAEIQELLQMFGLPYVIAPMEAEAQCAYMDTIQLVDGVVTDDSDVFLFGGRTVYRNLFDDRKYVETYYMKDLESEMGMSREKLIRIAMLLGSDYTEGISGIGIVNAIEVVNAFPEEDGLQKFKDWLDSPDHILFQKAREHSVAKGKGSGNGDKTGVGDSLDGDGAGDLDEPEGNKFTVAQQVFMHKHRVVSKNWNIPETFPSESVVTAYISPAIDKSAETFTWGRPDLEALRRFCYERFIWNKEKADELLLPVLKEYDRRETQTRLESFYHFNQRFAKIRSRRIQKAVTGMTGKRSAELMELPPHLIAQARPEKSPQKSKLQKRSDAFLESNAVNGNIHQPSDELDSAANTNLKGARRSGRGRRSKDVGKQSVELLDENVNNEEIRNDVGIRSGKIRAGVRGRGRGRATGKKRAGKDEEEEASSSNFSDSDDAMGETVEGIYTLKKKADEMGQPRRSTRQRSQVTTYQIDNSDKETGSTNSDEETGGTCSGGEDVFKESEDMFKEVDLLVAEAIKNKPKSAVPGTVDSGVRAEECTGSDKTSVLTEMAGPSEMSEFATGGGFCPCEEDDFGEQGKEISEPAVYALGGGFCVPEDEDELLADAENVINVEDTGQSRQIHRGGISLLEEDAKVLSQKDMTGENGIHHTENVELEKPYSDNSKEVDRGPLMQGTSVNENLILGISSEPAELGLRAIPFMRRKKRKSS